VRIDFKQAKTKIFSNCSGTNENEQLYTRDPSIPFQPTSIKKQTRHLLPPSKQKTFDKVLVNGR
jgi:hypothetical protein